MNLLSVAKDAKTTKGEKWGWLTAILYLAPYTLSGVNLCANATKGCIASCLFTAGRAGQFKAINKARLRKAREFVEDRLDFLHRLGEDIIRLELKAQQAGLKLCIRLNGTSDIPWENVRHPLWDNMNLMELFPTVQFYDYTKSFRRMHDFLQGNLPPNYHLTFSRAESNGEQATLLARMGANVAVVFDKVPDTWNSRPVVDGDLNDLRFLDPKGSIIGLKAKGKAKKDKSGFVIQ